MAKEKTTKVKAEKPRKEKVKREKKQKVQTQLKVIEVKHVKVPKRQMALREKKSRLAVAGRQTKWAPVWVVIKKYGAGKRVHPSAVTAYRRSWRRTKLDILPRKIRKWHMG
jgi:ribosomal protein L39E